MIWNIEDYNAPRDHKATTPWEAKAQDLTWTFNDNEPRFRHQKWREVFDDQIKSTPMSLIKASDPLFSLPLGQHLEPFTVWLPRDKIWERYNTISHISVTEGEKREVRISLSSLSTRLMRTYSKRTRHSWTHSTDQKWRRMRRRKLLCMETRTSFGLLKFHLRADLLWEVSRVQTHELRYLIVSSCH